MNRYYLSITLILLTLVACKQRQLDDNAKSRNQEKSQVRENKTIDCQEIQNPDDGKSSHEIVRRAVPIKASKNLIDVALKALNNSNLEDDKHEPTVTEDDKYFYVTWLNKDYDENPDSPGGGRFKVEVIFDKITKDVILVRMPN